jgi:hypothetical protein
VSCRSLFNMTRRESPEPRHLYQRRPLPPLDRERHGLSPRSRERPAGSARPCVFMPSETSHRLAHGTPSMHSYDRYAYRATSASSDAALTSASMSPGIKSSTSSAGVAARWIDTRSSITVKLPKALRRGLPSLPPERALLRRGDSGNDVGRTVRLDRLRLVETPDRAGLISPPRSLPGTRPRHRLAVHTQAGRAAPPAPARKPWSPRTEPPRPLAHRGHCDVPRSARVAAS